MLSIALALALSAAQQQAIVKYFDADLFDGATARWKWPTQGDKKFVYCGWVNAKNRMGAFTGWSLFTVTLQGTKIDSGRILDEKVAEDRYLKYYACESNGYDIHSPPRD